MNQSTLFKFKIDKEISDELVDFLFTHPYEIWNWLLQLLIPKKIIDRIWDPELTKDFVNFLKDISPKDTPPAELKRKILFYKNEILHDKKLSPNKYLKQLEEKKLIQEINGLYNKTPFYDMFVALLEYYLDLHNKFIKYPEAYEYFINLKNVILTQKQIIRWHTEGLYLLYLIKNGYSELTWKELNQLWKEFTASYTEINTYTSNMKFLNLLLDLKMIEKIPEKNIYKINIGLVEKIYTLAGKVVFQLVLFMKMLELNIYLPKRHYEIHLRSNDTEVFLSSNAKKIVYDHVSESKESIRLLLLATLVGDDEESKKALAKPLINKLILHSLVYYLPKHDSKDDREIRLINQAGGILKVILTEQIDFAPLAILDEKIVYYTPIQFMTESLTPIMAIRINDKKAVKAFLKEWDYLWEHSPVYEEVMDALKYLYGRFFTKEIEEIPSKQLEFLKKHNLIDKNGNITKLGEILIFERYYG